MDEGQASVETAEEAAARAMDELRARSTPVQVAQEARRFTPCVGCGGSKLDPNPLSAAWGGNCWLCGGWGYQVMGDQRLRGPFASRPRR